MDWNSKLCGDHSRERRTGLPGLHILRQNIEYALTVNALSRYLFSRLPTRTLQTVVSRTRWRRALVRKTRQNQGPRLAPSAQENRLRPSRVMEFAKWMV